MSVKQPPVTVASWRKQVKEDPSIPEECKNGNEDQLRLTDAAFKSGSLLNSTQFLYLRTIWSPHAYVTSLGDLMKNDPEAGWEGFVSDENMSKAESLFNEKESKWRPYLGELGERAGRPVPRQPSRPSLDLDHLWQTAYDQTQVIVQTGEEISTIEEVERAYEFPDSGNAHVEATIRVAVEQHITPNTPITPRFRATRQPNQFISTQGTPEVVSYQPGRGGKFNQPAADEEFVNSALLSFLKTLTGLIGRELTTLNWLGARLPLRLTETVTTTDPDTGNDSTELRPIMEARVDGYLYRTENPFEKKLNQVPLAIAEVKPFMFRTAPTAIRRQVGAEMASWISQAGDSTVGCLQPSKSGRKRRPMFTQHRHEIYIIIGEYGPGFEAYISPFRSVVAGSANTDPEAGKAPLAGSITERRKQNINPSRTLESMLPSRQTDVLWGSPASTKRVEDMAIRVSGDAGAVRRNPQPTQPPAATRKSTRKAGGKKWEPEVGDFLVMHEFGPFITTDRSHMDLFIRRYIALMLQLRGPQTGFIPDTVSTKFLDKPELGEGFAPGEASSSVSTLKKARSFGDEYKKPRWQG